MPATSPEPVVFADPAAAMRRAIELAQHGRGRVEPNPMVGAVIVDDELQLLGEGWHERYGGPHAEVNAIAAAGGRTAGATLFVTLEPCCHFGKTGPCSRAVLAAGIRRVFVGLTDPNAEVNGGGIAELRAAGVEVEVGLLADECAALAAPFMKLVTTGLPWVHAKWAMTLDGRIASRTGASRWISNESSRRIVHVLRGEMDAIVVGAGTVRIDDPLLTARPPGPRAPVRIVVDSHAALSVDSQLLKTVSEAPVLVATSSAAPADRIAALCDRGAEVFVAGDAARVDLRILLAELGRRRMTHVLIEGGSQLLGTCFDLGLVDEAHVFIAPKIVGGAAAPGPVAGEGRAAIPELATLSETEISVLDGDIYVRGRVQR